MDILKCYDKINRKQFSDFSVMERLREKEAAAHMWVLHHCKCFWSTSSQNEGTRILHARSSLLLCLFPRI